MKIPEYQLVIFARNDKPKIFSILLKKTNPFR